MNSSMNQELSNHIRGQRETNIIRNNEQLGSHSRSMKYLGQNVRLVWGLLIIIHALSYYCVPTVCWGEGNGTPLQYSCLENPMGGGAWQATVHGVMKSRTGLSDSTFTFHSHALEKEMATHSSVLAWRIPGTGEPGGLLCAMTLCSGVAESDTTEATQQQQHRVLCSVIITGNAKMKR